MERNGRKWAWATMAVTVLALAPIGVAHGQSYTVGDAPTIDAPPGVIPAGGGLALDESSLTDMDDVVGGGTVADVAVIDFVTIVYPSGRAIVLDGNDWKEWSPMTAGLYLALITLDDSANYANDDAVTYQFSFEVTGSAGCSSCRGGSGKPPLGAAIDLDNEMSMRFSLGTAKDGKPAGLIGVLIDGVASSTSLATPEALFYDLDRSDVEVIVDGSGYLRQILAPQVLADIDTIDSYEYHVRYFALADVGSKLQGVYQVTDGDEFKRWEIENPDGALAYDDLHVTEYVDNGAGGFTAHVRYEYHETATGEWTLTTKDPGTSNTLQSEEIDWVVISGTVDERREYMDDPNSVELHCMYERFTDYAWGARRTQLRIDPAGDDLTTSWAWNNSTAGLVVESAQRADGSWT